jgi:hypothetical protein
LLTGASVHNIEESVKHFVCNRVIEFKSGTMLMTFCNAIVFLFCY